MFFDFSSLLTGPGQYSYLEIVPIGSHRWSSEDFTDRLHERIGRGCGRGGKGGQKLKIVASRAEEEDAPGTWRERWGVLRGAETEASDLGFTGSPGLVLSPPGPFAALSTRLSQCSCALPQPKKFVGLGWGGDWLFPLTRLPSVSGVPWSFILKAMPNG